MKQLTNWFVNNRKRIWKPKLEEMKKQGSAVVSSSPSIEDKDAKRRKTNNKTTSKGATSAKSPIIKESKKEHVNDPLEGRVSPSTMPPLPPLEMATTNTVTPLVDSMIIGVADDVMSAAPLLPITDVQEIMPHSCNLVDPLTNKMVRLSFLHDLTFASCIFIHVILTSWCTSLSMMYIIHRNQMHSPVLYARHAEIGTPASSVPGT